MRVFIESLLSGDLAETKELLNAKLKDLVENNINQVKMRLAEDIYGDYGVDVGIEIEESTNNNVQRLGRTKLVKIRIRGGKIQRRKKLSATKGYTNRSGRMVRMSATEIRHRKIAARLARNKRRAKLQTSLRKRQRSLRKRHAMGL
jgi:hypothetical protein